MYERERDGRREAVVTDIEALVPENHLVRKIEKVMDYEWIYERVAPYYSTARQAVSYTHLDVYKRQSQHGGISSAKRFFSALESSRWRRAMTGWWKSIRGPA